MLLCILFCVLMGLKMSNFTIFKFFSHSLYYFFVKHAEIRLFFTIFEHYLCIAKRYKLKYVYFS